MHSSIRAWPVTKPDARSTAIFQLIPALARALNGDTSLFGLQILVHVSDKTLRLVTKDSGWLEIGPDGMRPRLRGALSPTESDAILALVESDDNRNIRSLVNHLPRYDQSDSKENDLVSLTFTRHGVLLLREKARRDSLSGAWRHAFLKEGELAVSELAEAVNLGLGLRMSGQIATLVTPDDEDIISTHRAISTYRDLRILFEQHLANLNSMNPKGCDFILHPDWHPLAQT